MKAIWRIICQDAKNVTSNVISIIVCMGMVIIPSMYAWFNTEGSWDPYTNTKNLKVAVANDDAGYVSSLIPMEVNVGDKVCSSLRKNDSIGWVFTDKTQAVEGIKSGKYYAALVIPKDFSRNLLTGLSDDPHQARLLYYSNEKENSIASIVTDKASGAVRTEIDKAFTQTVSEVSARTLSTLSDYMGDAQTMEFAKELEAKLEASRQASLKAADQMDTYAQLLNSVISVGKSSRQLLASPEQALDGITSSLYSSSKKVSGAAATIKDADAHVNQELQQVSVSFASLQKSIGAIFATGQQGASDTSQALTSVADQVSDAAKPYKELQNYLTGIGVNVPALDSAISHMDALESQLRSDASSIASGSSAAQADKDKLDALIAGAKQDISGLRSDLSRSLSTNLNQISSSLLSVAEASKASNAQLTQAFQDLEHTGKLTQENLEQVERTLEHTSTEIRGVASKIDAAKQRVAQARAQGDASQIKRILSSNPKDLASFISSPVGLTRHPIYPIRNNGSAMAPYYTTLSLWVGAIILVALVKVHPSEKELKETGAKPRQAYIGRLVFFSILALLQATLVGLGNLFYLQIQCVHPMLFMIDCWVSSFVYMNIIYALVVSFGDVGKALAVLLLVIQVAGSGGTFPQEMLPRQFQIIYPYLPFVSTMQGLRSAIAGVYGNEFIHAIVSLFAFLIPALLLGLVLRKPVIRLNQWVEHNIESTKIM